MFLVINTLFLYSVLVSGNDISFKGITISWALYDGTKGIRYVSSSNNLKENLPNTSSHILVDVINGSVPVLYENSVSDIRNLGKLKLQYVDLEEIQPRAYKNVQIWELQIKYNNISKLSRGIFENVELQILDFDSNGISKIEAGAFSGVKFNLGSKLSLALNQLEEIDPDVFNIPDLQDLELYWNKIETLRPGDFQNLPKLERLNLHGNKLKTIEEGVFQNSVLKELKLDFNEILSIDSKSFDNMTKLEWINLNSNNLTEWDKNWFYNTPSLRVVDFSYNRIKEISDKAFQNLDKVERLDLWHNEISKFSTNAFVKNEENGKVGIGSLNLLGNNLTCIDEPFSDVFGSVTHVYIHME